MKNIKKTIQRIWYFVKNNLCIFLHKFLWKKQHTHILLALDMCWGTVDSFVFLRLKFDGFAWKQFSCHINYFFFLSFILYYTLRFNYKQFSCHINYFFLCHLFNILHCDSIITRSPHGSQIFFQYTVCENISRRSRYTQCKLWKSYSLCIS